MFLTRKKLVECLGIWDCDCVMAQVASSSRTYFYLKHRSGHGNQSEKAFCSAVTKARAMKADAEVGTKAQQLSIALVVESWKPIREEHPQKDGMGKQARVKLCLAMKIFCPWAVC